MKKAFTFWGFLLILLLSPYSKAQQGWTTLTPEQRAKKLTGWMKDNLHLSQDQVPQVQQINLKYAQMQEDLKNASGSRSERMKQAAANDQAKDLELQQVMSQDQFTAYQKKKQTLQQQLKQQRRARKGEL